MTKTLNNEDRIYLVRSPGLSARMAYEAAYHFTVALFVSEGILVPKTHRGLNSGLFQTFVDKELFPRDIAAYLGQLEKDRNTAQYNPITKIQAADARRGNKPAKSRGIL